jgi:hypothetical protein
MPGNPATSISSLSPAWRVVWRMRPCGSAALLLAALASVTWLMPGAAAQTTGRHVVLVTIDGLRWQEFFGGANPEYFERNEKGEIDPDARQYDGPTPEARRLRLMPFVWSVVAREGQIFGDPALKGGAHVTNGLWFSYPGYNEMFAGVADPRIDSNDKVPNPNVTVFEWLNRRPGFEGKVVAFGSWDVLPFILNAGRSRLPVGTGYTPVARPATPRQREINELAGDLPAFWDYGPLDVPIVYAALDSLATSTPRALYLMLGEGDEWAHAGRYDLYLDATRRADRFIARLWNTLQSLAAYKGSTTLIVTTDHGRGATTKDWKDHGRKVPAAENTWIAAIGPAVPAMGPRQGVTVTAAQIAATVAAVVGEDFRAASPAAAPPLPFRE